MTFFEYYQSLKNQPSPAAEFVRDIASLCQRKEITVRKWLAGDANPDPHLQQKIADFIGIPAKRLFPKPIMYNKKVRFSRTFYFLFTVCIFAIFLSTSSPIIFQNTECVTPEFF